jgi:hypothetical protein
VDVDGDPPVVRNAWHRALHDVVERLVHGQKKDHDLMPPGEVGAGGRDGEVHEIMNAHKENRGSGGLGCNG